ncbi:MAG: crosslink repair DNA glycosylase YcaQ family protein [Bacteroidota bacterium]
MKVVELTKDEARGIILHAGGLAKRGQFGRGIEAANKLIDHLGFIQVDTNYVVERAHHHTLAARVPGYRPDWLEQLQTEGKVFEFWTYASGFMPMDDFRFSLPVKEALARRSKATQTDINLMRKVLDRISREGPLRVRDFENDRVVKSRGWWDLRPSKIALERLHSSGKLVSTRGKDFHKLYDLPANIIPGFEDLTMPTMEEFARHNITRMLKAHGVAYEKELKWSMRYVPASPVRSELSHMVDEGIVLQVQVAGLKAPLYMLPSYKNKKIKPAGDLFILSPFDNVNVFRHRLRDFFDFDYGVECFVPEAKRKYGYFSLPVLSGDQFIARMDSKADRKEKVLVINNLHFETKDIDTEKLSDGINDFAKFNGCGAFVIRKTNNKGIAKLLLQG